MNAALLLLLLYSAGLIALGLWIGRRVESSSSFFVAGRSLGPGLLFATLLAANGFEVHDLGNNVPVATFVDKAREVDADIIGLSSFLVTTLPVCSEVLDYLRDEFPDGSVTATLVTESGQMTILDRVGGSTGGEVAELTLWSLSGVDTGVDFSELKIETTIRLEGVTVLWQNYTK